MSLQNLPGGAGSEPSAEAATGREAPHDPRARTAPSGFRRLEVGEKIQEHDVVWPARTADLQETICAGYTVEYSDLGYYYRRLPADGGGAAPEASEGSPSLPSAPRRMRVRITKAGQPTYWYADKIGQEFLVEVSAHALESSFFVVPLTGETGARIIGRDDCEFLTFPVPAAPAALAPSVPKGGDEDELIADLRDALQAMVYTVNAAGVLNLSNGVQLGQTSWAIKMDNALIMARAALAKLEGR